MKGLLRFIGALFGYGWLWGRSTESGSDKEQENSAPLKSQIPRLLGTTRKPSGELLPWRIAFNRGYRYEDYFVRDGYMYLTIGLDGKSVNHLVCLHEGVYYIVFPNMAQDDHPNVHVRIDA